MITSSIFLLAWLGLTFHPVEQCRVIDTRVTTPVNMELPERGFMPFLVSGDGTRVGFKNRGLGPQIEFSFADQGGEADGCGVPRDAEAVVANFTVLPRPGRGSGHLRAWRHEVVGHVPFGGAPILRDPPRATVVNWAADQPVSNSVAVVRLCVEATAPFNDCNEDVVLEAWGGPAHVIVDVQGYFSQE